MDTSGPIQQDANISMIQTTSGYYWMVKPHSFGLPQIYKGNKCGFNVLNFTYPTGDYGATHFINTSPQIPNTFSFISVSNTLEIIQCNETSMVCTNSCSLQLAEAPVRSWVDKTGRWLLQKTYYQASLLDLEKLNQECDNSTEADIKTNLDFVPPSGITSAVFGSKILAVGDPYFQLNYTGPVGRVVLCLLDEEFNSTYEIYNPDKNGSTITTNFGFSIAISENFLVIGAPSTVPLPGQRRDITTVTDKIFIFKLVVQGDTINVTQLQVLQPSTNSMACGHSLAINAGILLVGCPADSNNITGQHSINNDTELENMMSVTSGVSQSGSFIIYSLDCGGINSYRSVICSPDSSTLVLSSESETLIMESPLAIINASLEIPRNVRNVYAPAFILSDVSTLSLSLGTQITTDSCAELNGTVELSLHNETNSNMDGTKSLIVNFNCTKPPKALKSLIIKQTDGTGSEEECGELVGTPEFSNRNLGVLFSVDTSKCGGESSESDDNSLMIGLIVGLVGGTVLIVIIIVIVIFVITIYRQKKQEAKNSKRDTAMIQF
eukprot:TRINITY_DN8108_c0_g1_i1.p1 TRINITY_DN8108_c0_g1~~TRINITY_DN8108_c0_g1_i1.p1  ORF type:complete len:633 (+),score=72.57 TRINITY_DN8108_c0_g1_i1:248-1900(+)